MEEDKLKESVKKIEAPDFENIDELYQSKFVYKNLALTRETIRYYEQIGLIHLKKEQGNQYRNFSMEDIQILIAIDSYKKRGFTASEIKQIIEKENISDIRKCYLTKKETLEQEIAIYQRYLNQMKADLSFLDDIERYVNTFTIREFPLYRVKDTLKAFTSFQDYQEHILQHIDTKSDAILDNIIRVVDIDASKYVNTKYCVVEETAKRCEKETYLISGKSIYTIVEILCNEENTMERMFHLCSRWLCEKNLEHLGVVYIRPKMMMNINQEIIAYHEAWIPFNEK